jgi:hypothetical protein
MRGGVVFVCLLALWVPFAGCAARKNQDALACPRGAPPDYALTFQSSPPSRDDTESVADLSREGELGFGHLALGLTEVQLSLSMSYNYHITSSLTAGVCIDPVRVTYRLAYAKRVVHVAREFDHEPCLHGEILAHEIAGRTAVPARRRTRHLGQGRSGGQSAPPGPAPGRRRSHDGGDKSAADSGACAPDRHAGGTASHGPGLQRPRPPIVPDRFLDAQARAIRSSISAQM